MNIAVRQIQGQEMHDTLYTLNQYSLHPSPPFQDKEEWLSMICGRKGVICHAVYEDEIPVSIAASSAMTQNMRGNLYPASGVWGVSTSPAARRKGYCRQAMASLLATEKEAGKIFSNLYPFRESFYQKLGYLTFPLPKIARFAPMGLTPLLGLEVGGELQVKLIGEAFQIYRRYLTKMRLGQHGMAFFDYGDQSMANRNRLWAAMAMFEDQIEGIMLYSLQGSEVTKFNFVASRFYYHTSRARYLLLNWIARHIDQADRVELWLAGDEHPETWLADLQVKVETTQRAPMSRVLNVPGISGMQVGEGCFQAQIIDPLCPWNQGVWRFETRDGKLRVSIASEAGCELTIQGLSGLVAGTLDPQDISLRGWGQSDLTQQAIQRRIFPRLYPYLHEVF